MFSMPIVPRELHAKYQLKYTLKQKSYQFGCHGNLLAITTRYVANAYCFKGGLYHTKYELNTVMHQSVLSTFAHGNFLRWSKALPRGKIFLQKHIPQGKKHLAPGSILEDLVSFSC